jgi:hypothetical protein
VNRSGLTLGDLSPEPQAHPQRGLDIIAEGKTNPFEELFALEKWLFGARKWSESKPKANPPPYPLWRYKKSSINDGAGPVFLDFAFPSSIDVDWAPASAGVTVKSRGSMESSELYMPPPPVPTEKKDRAQSPVL